MRQAAPVSYQECRRTPKSCLHKTVVWRVAHPARGVTFHRGSPSEPIRWRNEEDAPFSTVRTPPFEAAAIVSGVSGDAVELIYIGNPRSIYANTRRISGEGQGSASP